MGSSVGVESEKLHEFLATLPHFSFLFWSEFSQTRAGA